MNFLADECTDTQLVEQLRADGHDVIYVMESMRVKPMMSFWPVPIRKNALY